MTYWLAENVHDTSPHKVKEGDSTLDAVIKAGEVGGEEEENQEQSSVNQLEDFTSEGGAEGEYLMGCYNYK